MFHKNFVVSIKSGGKFFKENGDTIRIPFKTEYSLFFKNLENRRACVTVSIDGKDVLGGNRLIVEPNSTLDLDGYLDDLKAKQV